MPVAVDDQPTRESIQAEKTYLSNLWSEAHLNWEEADAFYWRRFPVWPREQQHRPTWRPSTASNVIDHATDTQLAYDPLVKRYPAGPGVTHERRADLVEPWLKAVLDEASLYEPSLPFKTIGKHLLLYGYAVIEGPALDMRDAPQKPERGAKESDEEFGEREDAYKRDLKNWFPIRIRAPHPARVLLNPLEKRPTRGIKVGARHARDLQQLTVEKAQSLTDVTVYEPGSNPYELVQTIEYWSPSWHAVMVDGGDLLYVEQNTWGFVPFKHAFAGFGGEPTELDDLDPSFFAKGLLDPIMDSLRRQAQEVSAKHNALIEASFQRMRTAKDPAEAARELRGDIVQAGPQDYGFIAHPDLPPWLFRIGEETKRDIEEGTYSQQLAGHREAGVSTVGQQLILSDAAMRKFSSPARQMEHLATLVASDILRLVDVLGEPMTVRGYTIGSKEIETNYACLVQFELIDPSLQIQNRRVGMQEVQMGLKSAETYRSADARIEDESGERRRLLKEELRKDPRVLKTLVEAVLREEGLESLIEAVEKKQLEDDGDAPVGANGPANPNGDVLSPVEDAPSPLEALLGGAAQPGAPADADADEDPLLGLLGG